MHNKILGEPTKRQSQIALSATTADFDNDQTDEQMMQQEATTDLKSTNSGDKFFVRYTHEQRFNRLKKDMHKVYDDIFQNTPAMCARLTVATRNRRDSKNELIRKRPKRTLLCNTITKRKCHSKISTSNSSNMNCDYLLCVSSYQNNGKKTKRSHMQIKSGKINEFLEKSTSTINNK